MNTKKINISPGNSTRLIGFLGVIRHKLAQRVQNIGETRTANAAFGEKTNCGWNQVGQAISVEAEGWPILWVKTLSLDYPYTSTDVAQPVELFLRFD